MILLHFITLLKYLKLLLQKVLPPKKKNKNSYPYETVNLALK